MSSIPPAATVQNYPKDAVSTSCFDPYAVKTRDVVQVGGGAVFTIASVAVGATGGPVGVVVVSAVAAAALFASKLLGYCGTATQFNQSVKKEEILQNRQVAVVSGENGVVAATAKIEAGETVALQTIGTLVQTDSNSTKQLEATEDGLKQDVQGLGADLLAARTDSNSEEIKQLKEQLAQATKIISDLHQDIQRASDLIPSLGKVELSLDASVDSFEANSKKITDGFKQMLSQLAEQSNKKQELEGKLQSMQTTIDELKNTGIKLETEKDLLQKANTTLTQLNGSLTNLGEKLEAGRTNLAAEKERFAEELSQWSKQNTLGANAIQTLKASITMNKLDDLIKQNFALLQSQTKTAGGSNG